MDIWSIHGDNLETEQVKDWRKTIWKNIVLWYTIQFNIPQIMSFVTFQDNIEIGYHKTYGY